MILRTAIDSLTVIDSTPVTFGGSATPTLTGLSTSDAITLTLDSLHDYFVLGYNDFGRLKFLGIEARRQ